MRMPPVATSAIIASSGAPHANSALFAVTTPVSTSSNATRYAPAETPLVSV